MSRTPGRKQALTEIQKKELISNFHLETVEFFMNRYQVSKPTILNIIRESKKNE
jgi:Mor family transcriptional regulator